MRGEFLAAASELLSLRAEFDELPTPLDLGALEGEELVAAVAEDEPYDSRRVDLILAMEDAQKRFRDASGALASIGVDPFDDED